MTENNRNVQLQGTGDSGNKIIINLHLNEDNQSAKGSMTYLSSGDEHVHTSYDDIIARKVSGAEESEDANDLDPEVDEVKP